MGYKDGPDRTFMEFAIPDGGVETDPTGLRVLVNDEGVSIVVVDDLSVWRKGR